MKNIFLMLLILGSSAFAQANNLVRYHAELTLENYLKALSTKGQPLLTGTAYLEDGQVLGTFEAIRE